MARQRITEDFVKHYRLMRDRCHSPEGVRVALDRDPQLSVSIKELYRIWHLIEQHRRMSRRRFIVQAHKQFAQAFEDYRENWLGSFSEVLDWEDVRAGREPFNLEKILADLNSKSEPSDSECELLGNSDDESWEFDPDIHSAAGMIERLADWLVDKREDGPFFSRTEGAFRWLTGTVGLNLKELEERWREFPVITVQENVSNVHGVDDPYSLFGYLENIRLSYMIAADLAAIAMCRAATEVLVRHHYDKDKSADAKLIPLIRRIQDRKELIFLRQANLIAKVSEANEILHVNRDQIKNRDRTRTLIRDWVVVLQQLIRYAPST